MGLRLTMRKRKDNYDTDEMLPEYDFRGIGGVRGKYYRGMRKGYTITIHKKNGSTIVKEVKPKGSILRRASKGIRNRSGVRAVEANSE